MSDTPIARRDLLRSLGLAPVAMWPLRAPATTPGGVAELARELILLDRDAAFTRVDELRRGGLTPHQALSAIFLAGIQEIRPRPVGFKLHAVMMVASAHQIVRLSPPAERWLPVFWNLGDLKRAQARDAAEGDWSLAPRVVGATDDPLGGLAAALLGDDEDAADRASVAAFATSDLDETFDALWPRALGDYHNLGHKIIHAAQSRRALDQLGWSHGEPVLRALAYALVAKGDDRARATWPATVAASKTLPLNWALGESEPGAALAILAALRPLDAEGAIATVAKASQDGASAATLLDALRLRALELLLNRPTLLAVHPLTALNAFRTVIARSAHVDTRRHALLQCAAWLGHYRSDLRVGDGDRAIDTLGATATSEPAGQVLAVAAENRDLAVAHAMHVARTPTGRQGMIEAARAVLVRKAQEHHDYKFAAAIFEEVGAAHPALAPRVLASAFVYLRHAGETETPDVTRALQLVG